jgi:1,2-diacylglycerol 3-beta-glucosyltransferase
VTIPWLDIGLSLAALPALGTAGYLGLLALLARRSGGPPPGVARLPRMAIVVPAHDEEVGISETVRSLLSVDYPRENYEVVVVADNCCDRTAEVARQAGARILAREDAERRGKGYALRFAFDHVLGEGAAEAIVVVDADTVVSPNILRAFAAHLTDGAGVLQAHYGVRNADESWRTRLLAIAFEAFHGVRSMARERLHLSCGLRGNGMAFAAEVLRAVPHEAFSVVEDLEYGIQLAHAGYRVRYVEEARVFGLMAVTETASRSQRQRWEGGRQRMAKTHAVPLLKKAWSERSLVLLDLALDILVPPLSTIALACAVGLAATGGALGLGARVLLAPYLWGASSICLAAYVLRGWALSELGRRGLLDLLAAPAYITWRIALRLRQSPHRPGEWVRTERRDRRDGRP